MKEISFHINNHSFARIQFNFYLGSDFLLPFRCIGIAFSLMCTKPVFMTSQSICIMEKWFAGGFMESENG